MGNNANENAASIASAAGPAYTVELAHPAYRGTMVSTVERKPYCETELGIMIAL